MAIPKAKKKKPEMTIRQKNNIIVESSFLIVASAISNSLCYRNGTKEDFEKILNSFCMQMMKHRNNVAPLEVAVEAFGIIDIKLFVLFKKFGAYEREAYSLMCGTMALALNSLGWEKEAIEKVIMRFDAEMQWKDYRWYINTVIKETKFDFRKIISH